VCKETALLGPQLVVLNDVVAIRNRNGVLQMVPQKVSPEDACIALLAVYFLLNLSFPGSYGQFMGFLQLLTFPDFPFLHETKKLSNILNDH
jgi:hypothetical protein